MKKNLFLIFICVFSVLFFSCDSEIYIKFLDSETAEIKFSTNLGNVFVDTVNSFSENPEGNIFNSEEIQQSAEEFGLNNVNVKNLSNSGFNLSSKIVNNSENLFIKTKIIQFENQRFELSSENLADFYNSCPSTFVSYFDLFMAPVFLQDNSTEEEWLLLIEEVYGKPLKDEIEKSEVNIILEKTDGTKMNKKIPLSKILCLKENIKI